MTRDVLLSFLLLLISGYFLTSVVAQTCPPDWLFFQEKCYGFGEEAVDWGAADDICRIFGGRLAEVETAAENAFLKNSCGMKKGDLYWLGGTDIFHEGVWRWASTGDLINSFTDWGPDDPNDYEGEDCLAMWQTHGYQWVDYSCNLDALFICEANPLDAEIVG